MSALASWERFGEEYLVFLGIVQPPFTKRMAFDCILHFSSKYLAIFGVVGVCFNPLKGLVLLKTARNFKDSDNFETYSIDVEKKRNQILWYTRLRQTVLLTANIFESGPRPKQKVWFIIKVIATCISGNLWKSLMEKFS